MRQVRFVSVVAAVMGLVTAAAWAQSGPGLLLKPWQEGQQAEFSFDTTVQTRGYATSLNGSSVSNDELKTRIVEYDAAGRWLLAPDHPCRLTVGFEMTALDIDGYRGPIASEQDRNFGDQSLSVGLNLGEVAGWKIDAVAGVGFGYGGFESSDDEEIVEWTAFYGRGDLIATRQLDENSSLVLLLDYNRNRSVFPDIPLPGIMYNRRVSDTLRYGVGLPLNTVWWQPADRWTITVNYAVPFSFDAEVAYEVVKGLSLFAGFENRFKSFFVDDSEPSSRAFFEQKRVEAGLRWSPCPHVRFLAAGGYAFDQSLSSGWDARDDDDVADFHDEPFFRLGVDVAF